MPREFKLVDHPKSSDRCQSGRDGECFLEALSAA